MSPVPSCFVLDAGEYVVRPLGHGPGPHIDAHERMKHLCGSLVWQPHMLAWCVRITLVDAQWVPGEIKPVTAVR